MKYSHETYCLQVGLKTLGYNPGPTDGLRGRKTEAALLASKAATCQPDTQPATNKPANKPAIIKPPRASLTTKPPRPTTADKNRTFGKAGDPPMAYIQPPYAMVFSWNGKPVSKIGCHQLIAAPLQAALAEIADKGSTWIQQHGLHLYAGCYANRSVRGGKSLSDHAWAIAIDLNPDANGNHQTWRPGTKASNGTYHMPSEAVAIFRKHGFQVGFPRTNGTRRDMMHIAYIDRP